MDLPGFSIINRQILFPIIPVSCTGNDQVFHIRCLIKCIVVVIFQVKWRCADISGLCPGASRTAIGNKQLAVASACTGFFESSYTIFNHHRASTRNFRNWILFSHNYCTDVDSHIKAGITLICAVEPAVMNRCAEIVSSVHQPRNTCYDY